MQQLDGDRNFLAGFGVIEKNNGLEIVTHGCAAAIEVENLWHRTIGVRVELKPDPCARQVVPAQRSGNLKGLPKPNRIVGSFGSALNPLPAGAIELGGLSASQ